MATFAKYVDLVGDGYILWRDGDITVDSDKIVDMLLMGVEIERLHPLTKNEDIDKFNRYSDRKLTIKESNRQFSIDWKLPSYYKHLNVEQHIRNVCTEKIENDSKYSLRIFRFEDELKEIKQRKLDDVLRVLIYILDTFKSNGVVWGVGRGSSCASYVFYLLGLHCVDCVKYGIDMTEFFK